MAAAQSGGNRRRRPVPAAAGDVDPFGEGDELAARRAKRGDADVAGMRGRDRAYAAAYKAGRAGKPAPVDVDEQTRQAWETGAEDRAAPPASDVAETGGVATRSKQRGSGAPSPLDRTAAGASRAFPLPIPGEPGGFLLGVIAYTLALNFIQGGAGQVRAWLAAKFLNRVGAAGASSKPATPAKPSTSTYPSPTPRVGQVSGGPG